MRMLIVDDSKFMRSFIRAHTERLSFETEQAADGREALAKLNASPPFDIVLIDWDMPVMDGIELLTAMREHRRFDKVKILMVTARTGQAEVVEALSRGADEYLMKPITSEMIAEKLRAIGLLH
jgi:two-component system, chemotaxis family, chemotaxis protein CheY